MRAQELRIGNYIDFDGKASIVKEIDEQGVVVFIKETDETEWIDLFQFTPISLSEEILLKCGFEDVSSYNDFWLVIEDDLRIEVHLRHGGRIICGVSDMGLYDDMKYLHQLQNLYFSLTGEELQIEL